jgi:hypothetical protein
MVKVSIFLLPLFGTIWQKMKKGTGYFFLTPSALKLCKFCKSDPIVFLLTTDSFYYIFLRGDTEKAEISGFMGGGIPIFNKRQRTSFLLSE